VPFGETESTGVGGGVSTGLVITRTGKVYSYLGASFGSSGTTVAVRAGYIISQHTNDDVSNFPGGPADSVSATRAGLSFGSARSVQSGLTAVEVGIGYGDGSAYAHTVGTLVYDYDRNLW